VMYIPSLLSLLSVARSDLTQVTIPTGPTERVDIPTDMTGSHPDWQRLEAYETDLEITDRSVVSSKVAYIENGKLHVDSESMSIGEYQPINYQGKDYLIHKVDHDAIEVYEIIE